MPQCVDFKQVLHSKTHLTLHLYLISLYGTDMWILDFK